MSNSFLEKIKELTDKLKPKPSIFNTKKEIDEYGQAFKGEKAKRSINQSDMSEIEENLKPAVQPRPGMPIEQEATAANPETQASRPAPEKKTLGTNLIQGEIVSYFDWKEAIIFLILFAVIGLGVIGLLYSGLLFWEQHKKEQGQVIIEGYNEQQQQIARLEKEVEKIARAQKKIKSVKAILDSHIYWTNFFSFLENHTLSNVYYDNFTGDTGGSYSLASHAPNYQALAQQVYAFRDDNKNVQEVTVMSGSSGSDKEEGKLSIDFTIDLTINPEIFLK